MSPPRCVAGKPQNQACLMANMIYSRDSCHDWGSPMDSLKTDHPDPHPRSMLWSWLGPQKPNRQVE